MNEQIRAHEVQIDLGSMESIATGIYDLIKPMMDHAPKQFLALAILDVSLYVLAQCPREIRDMTMEVVDGNLAGKLELYVEKLKRS